MRPATIVLALSLVALPISARERPHVAASPRTLAWLGGSSERLAWRDVFDREESFDEWEVFFSANGGEHYFIRLTPRLDRAVREYDIIVPDLPVHDGRLLFRCGDEAINERGFEAAVRVTIRYTGTTAPRVVSSVVEGERAYEADSPVTMWVTGDPEGKGAILVVNDAGTVSSRLPLQLRDRRSVENFEATPPKILNEGAGRGRAQAAIRPRPCRGKPVERAAGQLDVLRQTSRINI